MDTPKPKAPVVILTVDHLDTVTEQHEELKTTKPKPKAHTKPKAASYIPKNQPLKDHPGLVALKSDLEKR